MSENALELADFIENLRSELQTAMQRGDGAVLRFLPESIDLELKVAAETSTDGSGKISFKVFGVGAEAGGAAGASNTVTQSIKLKLSLVDENGEKRLISAPRRDGLV